MMYLHMITTFMQKVCDRCILLLQRIRELNGTDETAGLLSCRGAESNAHR